MGLLTETSLSPGTWQELDEKLASRVQVSQRAVAKIIQVFDHLLQRNEKVSRALRGEKEEVAIVVRLKQAVAVRMQKLHLNNPAQLRSRLLTVSQEEIIRREEVAIMDQKGLRPLSRS